MAPVPGAAAAALLAAVLLLACSPVCQARSASRLGEASSGLRRLLSYAIVWPVTVESQCYSELSFYLLVNFDTYGHNGPLCLDVPEPALCQEYFVLGPNATMSAAYASISTKAWLLLEDTDSFARPATYTDGDGSLQYATVFNGPLPGRNRGLPAQIQDMRARLPKKSAWDVSCRGARALPCHTMLQCTWTEERIPPGAHALCLPLAPGLASGAAYLCMSTCAATAAAAPPAAGGRQPRASGVKLRGTHHCLCAHCSPGAAGRRARPTTMTPRP